MAELGKQGLEQLRDIHLPATANDWPPAPGWIFLLIFLLLISISIGVFVWRSYSLWKTKRHALQMLKNYQKQYPQTLNSQKACALVNELLKTTAFLYYPRTMVASLTGQAWLNFLNQTMLHRSFCDKIFLKFMGCSGNSSKDSIQDFTMVTKELLEYPYQNHQDIRLDDFFAVANIWIKKQRHFNKQYKDKLCLS